MPDFWNVSSSVTESTDAVKARAAARMDDRRDEPVLRVMVHPAGHFPRPAVHAGNRHGGYPVKIYPHHALPFFFAVWPFGFSAFRLSSYQLERVEVVEVDYRTFLYMNKLFS